MHEAKRALIMAAGTGKRMRPLTLTTPKPLVQVNGVRMIDTVIQALQQNSIFDIYIVVGYLKEQFAILQDMYDGIHFIENPYFACSNNISSLYVAREYLGECVIVDGDQMVYRPQIFERYFSKSCYCCRWTKEQTDEWLLELHADRVTGCSRTGGSMGWQLYSVSFWTKEDGKRLGHHLELEFEKKKNDQIYWDDVALFCYPQEYDLGIRKIRKGDLAEIDSLKELAQIDSRYQHLVEAGKEQEQCQKIEKH